ncbi:hypothetical protein H4R34_001049 [Dimargaris verticillata]|uniref:Uncharacterized protein n=1 Tax=Dimargaris verticillata TaxID=2761393 RepID=A0A9W8BAQ2_9FUNG|nr:hypothetical protein H4R34_001049 [Dimargaris verticillata]
MLIQNHQTLAVCGAVPTWVLPRAPPTELFVTDFDQTLTLPDTITALATLTWEYHEKQSPGLDSHRQTWTNLAEAYNEDWKAYQRQWQEGLAHRYAQNQATCEPSPVNQSASGSEKDGQVQCLTLSDLGDYLVGLDAVESRSLHRIVESDFFRGVDRQTILSYGAANIVMQSGAIDAIRHWLHNETDISYTEHPWQQPWTSSISSVVNAVAVGGNAAPKTPGLKDQPTTSASATLVEQAPTGTSKAEPRRRDWAILSVNWSRDLILGALLPLFDLAYQPAAPDAATVRQRIAEDHQPLDQQPCVGFSSELYQYLVNKVYCNDLDYSLTKQESAPGASDTPNQIPSAAPLHKTPQLQYHATGTMTAPLRTGVDKLVTFRKVVSQHNLNLKLYNLYSAVQVYRSDRPAQHILTSEADEAPALANGLDVLSIYAGDSVNDLFCLLEADVGIVVGNDKELNRWCQDLGVEISNVLPPYHSLTVVSNVKEANITPRRQYTLRKKPVHQPLVMKDAYDRQIPLPSTLGPIYRLTNWEQFQSWISTT